MESYVVEGDVPSLKNRIMWFMNTDPKKDGWIEINEVTGE